MWEKDTTTAWRSKGPVISWDTSRVGTGREKEEALKGSSFHSTEGRGLSAGGVCCVRLGKYSKVKRGKMPVCIAYGTSRLRKEKKHGGIRSAQGEKRE